MVTHAAAIRSKCDWYEVGDSNSKLFLNLEKSRADQKSIRRLELDNGKITTEAREILNEELRYYNHLYTSHQVNSQNSDDLYTTTSSKIKEEDKESLTTDITEDEVWKIIKQAH